MASNIADKIRKLLELAKSPNLNEAASAAAEAQRLMIKHGIASADLDSPEGVETVFVDRAESRQTWFRMLAHHTAEACFCDAWRAAGDVPRITMIGRKADVVSCSILLDYLSREIIRLANVGWVVLRPREQQTVWKNAFKAAAAKAVGQRLKDSRKTALLEEQAISCNALVMIEKYASAVQAQIVAWQRKQGMTVVTKKVYHKRSLDGAEAGRRAGEAINLTPPTRALRC